MPHVSASYADAPDSQPVAQARLDDLNMDRVHAHMEVAVERGRLERRLEPLDFLERTFGIAAISADAPMQPTIAGLLMFADLPQRQLPFAVVDLAHFYGIRTLASDVVHHEKGISGPLPEVIDTIERYLWSNIHHGFRLEDGAQRVEEHEYPRPVLRELTVNALAHRDYLSRQYTRVALFRNRIEWDNPGCLPEGVTIKTILNAQMPRNPSLLNYLYQAGYVEAFGMGWDTVYYLLEKEDLPLPKLAETDATFLVTVFGRAHGASVNLEQAYHPLTPIHKAIYRFLQEHGTVSRGDIESAFPDRSARSLQRDVQELQEYGLVEAIGSTRDRRYRLMT